MDNDGIRYQQWSKEDMRDGKPANKLRFAWEEAQIQKSGERKLRRLSG